MHHTKKSFILHQKGEVGGCNVDVNRFAKRIQVLHWRLAELYQGVNGSVQTQPDVLLPTAFKELATTSEELQVAVEELIRQNEELVAVRKQLQAERQRYQDFFEVIPNACWITDPQGKILEANRAAATLLNVDSSYLRDKLLINFIPLRERPAFHFKLNQLCQRNWVQQWTIRLQPRNDDYLEASVSVYAICDEQGQPVTVRWIVRDTIERQWTQQALNRSNSDPDQERPLHTYSKGELIPLTPTYVWVVSQGVVKLTTMSESGDEVLIGLAGSSMPFGSGMTALPTYQATALSETVQLVCFSPTEISTYPSLTQALLPQVNQRLRQTEWLLAIAGKRQVKDRLHHLLLLLKQEIGVPVTEGTRLSVRLTHQDLADACGTTRVTITRLLGQLQKQGKIAFDSKHHLIVKD
ncbi:MAG: helix-turn-helix domain-containing protein [Cyanobacteriota bacterium]